MVSLPGVLYASVGCAPDSQPKALLLFLPLLPSSRAGTAPGTQRFLRAAYKQYPPNLARCTRAQVVHLRAAGDGVPKLLLVGEMQT